MSEVVLKVENISKQYRLGLIGTGTLSHDLNRWWHLARGKEDPYLQIGEVNDREKSGGEYVWALKNVNFEVRKGEVLGVIGKNGAGKSTLLKLLSQVTNPTKGSIKIKGRIASLLEVGTGFHPELTGRENIFLNGAILGMTKIEISSKLDEIIDFSGVDKYIDTPVKRYSSGMKVRLGFAVAAHLESEILVVDEVLAVGDAEFQKKCIGKMQNIAGNGRTVLFVSHNMNSVSQLCTRGIVLKNGEVNYSGNIKNCVNHYLSKVSGVIDSPVIDLTNLKDRKGNGVVSFKEINFFNSSKSSNLYEIGDDVCIKLKTFSKELIDSVKVAVHIYEEDESKISNIENIDSQFQIKNLSGDNEIEILIENINLYPGTYKLGFWIASQDGFTTYDHVKYIAVINIVEGSPKTYRTLSRNAGLVYYQPKWKVT